MSLFEHTPSFKARLQGARRESKIYTGITPNCFRKPFGPGWALAGDAGYIRDPITAQGISDAFSDAELLSGALATVFSGTRSFETALADFQAVRDARSMPVYELTCQIASLQPPPLELQQLLGAIHGNQAAMDAFVKVNAGSLAMPDFLAECSAKWLAAPGR
jgi:2-polyprenyl-6-methoxyphenol hydroxylase-like FAD-dependent oxidoreductase